MSFLDQVEKIQKKPESSRQKIAAMVTFALTGLIVFVWVTVSNPLGVENESENNTKYEPLSILKDIKDTTASAGSMLKEVKSSFGEIKEYSDMVKNQNKEEEQQSEESTTTEDYGQNQ